MFLCFFPCAFQARYSLRSCNHPNAHLHPMSPVSSGTCCKRRRGHNSQGQIEGEIHSCTSRSKFRPSKCNHTNKNDMWHVRSIFCNNHCGWSTLWWSHAIARGLHWYLAHKFQWLHPTEADHRLWEWSAAQSKAKVPLPSAAGSSKHNRPVCAGTLWDCVQLKNP